MTTRMVRRSRQVGITLVEMTVVVAILAILAAIAIPNYTEAVARSARKDARTALSLAAQWIENNQSRSRRFDQNQAGTAITLPGVFSRAPEAGNVRYNIALGDLTATTYTLTATPAGAQANDECGAFRIDQSGARCLVDASVTTGTGCAGHTTNGALFDRCWGR